MKTSNSSVSITVSEAAEAWLAQLETRKRRPAKPATIRTFQYHVTKIKPVLGGLEVGKVGVAILRDFIASLHAAGLSPKTQVEIAGTVKQIVASCVDAEGEPMFPRRWSNDKLDLPLVNSAEQHTPSVTREQIEEAIANSGEPFRYLYALAAASGLRIGVLLAIKLVEDGHSTIFDADAATIRVRRSLWRGVEQSPKTAAAVRDVELPSSFSNWLRESVGERSGFLFGNGAPLNENTARSHLSKSGLPGFHAFRRFRATTLRGAHCPEDVLRYWLAHSSASITDRYSKLGLDPAVRRTEVERCGLGFTLPQQKEGPALS